MRCEYCGAGFDDPKHPDRRFCSLQCSGFATARKRGQAESVERNCDVCGTLFKANPSANQRLCSTKCSGVARSRDRKPCEICGKPVRLMRNRFCSKSCSNLAREKPGVTSFSGFYHRAQKANPHPEPCADCGNPGEHRHHDDYGKPEDVVWLCAPCHRRRHQLGVPKSEQRVRWTPPILK